jgi:class 3 adenylate cyclase/Tfp pilus assembly protein PilF
MKKSKLLLILLLICLSNQVQASLDSLYMVWQDQNKADSTRAMAYKEYIWNGFLFSQPDTAFIMAQELINYGFDKNCLNAQALGYNIQGATWHVRGSYTKALDYYTESLKIQKQIGDQKGIAICLNNIGLIYVIQSDYPKALDYYQQGLKIEEEMRNPKGIATSLNNIGIIYNDLGNYPKALDYYTRSLKIKEKIGDQKGVAASLNNIGIIYNDQGDYAKALEYHTRSLKIKEQIGDQMGMAPSLHNIGIAYERQDDYTMALDYFNQSLKIKEQFGDQKGIAESLKSIGEIYMIQNNYSTALGYYMRSLKISEEILDKRGTAITLNNIGEISNKLGDHLQALNWCNIALETSKEINILKEQKNACQCLFNAYKALGNSLRALEFHEEIARLEDSLRSKETTEKLQQMEFSKQILADSLKQEEEKLKVQLAHDKEVRHKKRTRNIYFLSAVLFLIFAVGFYRRIRFVKMSKLLIEKEKNRSDRLLLNILPSEIAEELKEKGKAKARVFDKVTVLFTDFKGFTKISEKLSAEELVDEINSCFEPFDAICKKYGIEKIKTIGDSYMAAGGLPVPSGGSVKKTVLAGIEMMEFIIKRKKEREEAGALCFEMRLGIHTGPVVAGIVGVSKFQYDIWGDSVNIASRLEASGEVGKVNISQSTYELLKDDPDFKFYPRGKIKVKDKEDMEMWFVEKS